MFAAERAAQILENSLIDEWRHVKYFEKRADEKITRMSIEELRQSMWLKELAQLQKDEDKWSKT